MSIETGCMKDWENDATGARTDEGIDAGAHYRCEIAGIDVDPYYMAKVIGMTDHVQFGIFKKAWRLGGSVKDKKQDYLDIISAAKRGIELLDGE